MEVFEKISSRFNDITINGIKYLLYVFNKAFRIPNILSINFEYCSRGHTDKIDSKVRFVSNKIFQGIHFIDNILQLFDRFIEYLIENTLKS